MNDNTPTFDDGQTPATASVAEGTTAVGTYSASDADGSSLTYTVEGTDAALFTIDNTGALSFRTAPDFEAPSDRGQNNVYDVVVRVSDGTSSATRAVTITVTNVDESPTWTEGDAAVSVAEGARLVDSYRATDPEGRPLTYSLSGDDAALFTLTPEGDLSFRNAPDFENRADAGQDNVYNVIVTASDGTNPVSRDVVITVTNVDEAPSWTEGVEVIGVAEGVAFVYDYRATDPEGGAITYTLSGDDAALFTINAEGGLSFRNAPNFETPADRGQNNVYNVTVTASDGANPISR